MLRTYEDFKKEYDRWMGCSSHSARTMRYMLKKKANARFADVFKAEDFPKVKIKKRSILLHQADTLDVSQLKELILNKNTKNNILGILRKELYKKIGFEEYAHFIHNIDGHNINYYSYNDYVLHHKMLIAGEFNITSIGQRKRHIRETAKNKYPNEYKKEDFKLLEAGAKKRK